MAAWINTAWKQFSKVKNEVCPLVLWSPMLYWNKQYIFIFALIYFCSFLTLFIFIYLKNTKQKRNERALCIICHCYHLVLCTGCFSLGSFTMFIGMKIIRNTTYFFVIHLCFHFSGDVTYATLDKTKLAPLKFELSPPFSSPLLCEWCLSSQT